MKPYKNIYIAFKEGEHPFEGTLKVPYTGEIYYGVEEDPQEEGSWYIECPCDFEELAGFNKTEEKDNN